MSSDGRIVVAVLLILVSVITLLGSGCGFIIAVLSPGGSIAGYACCAIGLTLTILLWAWVIRMLRRKNQDPFKEVR
jgi:protein-S-isoprenylcysteine O-methyltransferase Ste14